MKKIMFVLYLLVFLMLFNVVTDAYLLTRVGRLNDIGSFLNEPTSVINLDVSSNEEIVQILIDMADKNHVSLFFQNSSEYNFENNISEKYMYINDERYLKAIDINPKVTVDEMNNLEGMATNRKNESEYYLDYFSENYTYIIRSLSDVEGDELVGQLTISGVNVESFLDDLSNQDVYFTLLESFDSVIRNGNSLFISVRMTIETILLDSTFIVLFLIVAILNIVIVNTNKKKFIIQRLNGYSTFNIFSGVLKADIKLLSYSVVVVYVFKLVMNLSNINRFIKYLPYLVIVFIIVALIIVFIQALMVLGIIFSASKATILKDKQSTIPVKISSGIIKVLLVYLIGSSIMNHINMFYEINEMQKTFDSNESYTKDFALIYPKENANYPMLMEQENIIKVGNKLKMIPSVYYSNIMPDLGLVNSGKQTSYLEVNEQYLNRVLDNKIKESNDIHNTQQLVVVSDSIYNEVKEKLIESPLLCMSIFGGNSCDNLKVVTMDEDIPIVSNLNGNLIGIEAPAVLFLQQNGILSFDRYFVDNENFVIEALNSSLDFEMFKATNYNENHQLEIIQLRARFLKDSVTIGSYFVLYILTTLVLSHLEFNAISKKLSIRHLLGISNIHFIYELLLLQTIYICVGLFLTNNLKTATVVLFIAVDVPIILGYYLYSNYTILKNLKGGLL